MGKPLFRKTKDGRIFEWKVENDHPLCTLQDAFEKVEHSVGFNIELKLDDHMVYTAEDLTRVLQAILQACHLPLQFTFTLWQCVVLLSYGNGSIY